MTLPFHKLQPPAILLMGGTGAGKTDALATFIEAGVELFVVVTEPDGAASLIDSVVRRGLDMEKLHWRYCSPAAAGWIALQEMVETIGKMNFQQIQDIKAGVGKTETREVGLRFLNCFANFRCDRTGKDYGPVDKWEPDRALALDSLSGFNEISMMLTQGYKPTAHQGEWGISMNFIKSLLTKLLADRNYFFALTAHMEREADELSGGSKTMVSTLGRKLAPKVPHFFSEVVHAKRTFDKGTAKFLWSTVEHQMDLKNRSLPISSEIAPTFVPVVEAYRRRLDSIGAPPPAPPEPVAEVKPLPVILTPAAKRG